ncbi:MAG: transposase family protein [Lachnospiraceae bacterium]|nr:transposase family protein [Lachnospiraceae bacterium]
MLEILKEQYKKGHARGGKPPKLNVLDKLIIMLCYYREYRTIQHIAFDYNVSKSTICESIEW